MKRTDALLVTFQSLQRTALIGRSQLEPAYFYSIAFVDEEFTESLVRDTHSALAVASSVACIPRRGAARQKQQG